jgi:sulfate permease, SulP family
VGISLMMYLYRTSMPHMAIIGQVPGTQQFKNVDRNEVVTCPKTISMRIDESIYFPNARLLESKISELVASHAGIEHFILNCSAVNSIDASGLESLKSINQRLKDSGITFHLSEVKGPIMDGLNKTAFLKGLTGKIFISHYDAICSINPELALNTLRAERL